MTDHSDSEDADSETATEIYKAIREVAQSAVAEVEDRLNARIAAQQLQITELERRLAELERRLAELESGSAIQRARRVGGSGNMTTK